MDVEGKKSRKKLTSNSLQELDPESLDVLKLEASEFVLLQEIIQTGMESEKKTTTTSSNPTESMSSVAFSPCCIGGVSYMQPNFSKPRHTCLCPRWWMVKVEYSL